MNKVYAILLWFALLFCHNGLLAQNGGVIVTGKVYAEDEPEGFIGATVIEQDKNGRIYSSALTDFNGNFSLKIKNPNNSLNFSFVGYKKLTVSIGNKRKFDVKLESQNVMKEVTVKASKLVGGGGLAIPEREYSGAMQKFNTKAIEGVSVASIDDALQGRIAGLDIVANSGDLGSGSVMRIRGITSINSNSFHKIQVLSVFVLLNAHKMYHPFMKKLSFNVTLLNSLNDALIHEKITHKKRTMQSLT